MARITLSDAPAIQCQGCGSSVAAALLACPNCHQLVHAEQLTMLARDAEAATERGETTAALATWDRALALLPTGSRQRETIEARIQAIGREVAAADDRAMRKGGGSQRWAWLGGAGAVLAFVATKGKLLLLGLTKSTTLFSMLASFGLYWTQWGMLFAGGLVLSIYVHEMGHVAALRRYGIPASPPMFVPGLGAFVRMRQMPASAHENARIGLAGPLWGLGAAVAAFAAFLLTGNQLWAAVAHAGAWLNLFNLLPVWQLDGSRGFVSLARTQRWVAAVAVAIAWRISGEGLLVLLFLAAAARAWLDRTAPEEGDAGALGLYVGLLAALTFLILLTPFIPRP
jgi:Zn-dependent protease